MAQKPLVSIVIVTIDHLKDLNVCLRCVFSQNYQPIEVIVVDNGSKPPVGIALKKRFPKVRIVRNKQNCGFAPAADWGLRLARGRYILFLNDDAVVLKNTITAMLSVFQKERNVFGCQAGILQWGTTRVESQGFVPTWFGFFAYPGRFAESSSLSKEPREIFGGTFACFLLDRKKFLEIGGFDTSLFLYQDDADVCWRARSKGYRIFFAPCAIAVHKISHSAKAMDHAFVLFHSFKNRMVVIVKNLEAPYIFAVLPLHVFSVFAIAVFYIATGKVNLGIAVLRAILVNAVSFPTLFSKRQATHKARVISDRNIFAQFPISFSLSYFKSFGLRMLKEW